VLVTGFDPFGGGNSNPSGILAQRLDGMTLQYGSDDVAIVEGVTFPVRYNEFDKGMVEEFAGPLLNDPEQNIFMVMTISLYGSNNHVHLDRFASRNRAGHADNSGVQSTTDPEVLPALGSGGDPQFIESRFPLREMLVDPNMPANVAVRQDGSYRDANGDLQTYDGGDDTVTPAEYREFANGNTTQDPLPPIPSGDITANEGPGGDYLSNEIFYRMSMLTRAVDGRNIPNIHLHIPRVGIRDEANNSRFTIDSILESARQTLAVAVRNHNP
jgi:pyrrolidone-carboxylate peptidase